MQKIINYEKDILFKTSIGEISAISLEHDFTLDGNFIKGDFIVSGEYKANELSVNKEKFNHRLPLEYELDENVDLSTISYDVENFEYSVHDDELGVYIDFSIKYDEKELEKVIPEITEEELNKEDDDTTIAPLQFETREASEIDNVELSSFGEDEKEILLNSAKEDDTYVTYHVHIVREGDSLESIAQKYNVSAQLIKDYNNFEALELKSKLIIPDLDNE